MASILFRPHNPEPLPSWVYPQSPQVHKFRVKFSGPTGSAYIIQHSHSSNTVLNDFYKVLTPSPQGSRILTWLTVYLSIYFPPPDYQESLLTSRIPTKLPRTLHHSKCHLHQVGSMLVPITISGSLGSHCTSIQPHRLLPLANSPSRGRVLPESVFKFALAVHPHLPSELPVHHNSLPQQMLIISLGLQEGYFPLWGICLSPISLWQGLLAPLSQCPYEKYNSGREDFLSLAFTI